MKKKTSLWTYFRSVVTDSKERPDTTGIEIGKVYQFQGTARAEEGFGEVRERVFLKGIKEPVYRRWLEPWEPHVNDVVRLLGQSASNSDYLVKKIRPKMGTLDLEACNPDCTPLVIKGWPAKGVAPVCEAKKMTNPCKEILVHDDAYCSIPWLQLHDKKVLSTQGLCEKMNLDFDAEVEKIFETAQMEIDRKPMKEEATRAKEKQKAETMGAKEIAKSKQIAENADNVIEVFLEVFPPSPGIKFSDIRNRRFEIIERQKWSPSTEGKCRECGMKLHLDCLGVCLSCFVPPSETRDKANTKALAELEESIQRRRTQNVAEQKDYTLLTGHRFHEQGIRDIQ